MKIEKEPKGILLHWIVNVKRRRKEHILSDQLYSKLDFWWGTISALFAASVGTSIFATMSLNPAWYWKLAVGLVSFLSAIIMVLHTYYKFGEKAEKHRSAGMRYSSIKREIEESMFKIEDLSKEEANELLSRIRTKIDIIHEGAPQSPKRIFEKVYKEWPERQIDDYKEEN